MTGICALIVVGVLRGSQDVVRRSDEKEKNKWGSLSSRWKRGRIRGGSLMVLMLLCTDAIW